MIMIYIKFALKKLLNLVMKMMAVRFCECNPGASTPCHCDDEFDHGIGRAQ